VITKRRRNDNLHVNAEINLTNLIDIAFVLLIIFMITAPILQGGVDLKLPKADTAPIESSDAVVVSLTVDGKIYIDKAVVTMAELGQQIQRYANRTVSIRADQDVPSGQLTKAIAIINKAGVTSVGLMAEPEDNKQ
jgi:biopolymer transport protein ExbD/biopolymer transport protein TolR